MGFILLAKKVSHGFWYLVFNEEQVKIEIIYDRHNIVFYSINSK